MAKGKASPAAGFTLPSGTYVYFVLKPDATVLLSYGAGTSTLDFLLSSGWTAERELALTGGGVLLVLKR